MNNETANDLIKFLKRGGVLHDYYQPLTNKEQNSLAIKLQLALRSRKQ